MYANIFLIPIAIPTIFVLVLEEMENAGNPTVGIFQAAVVPKSW